VVSPLQSVQRRMGKKSASSRRLGLEVSVPPGFADCSKPSRAISKKAWLEIFRLDMSLTSVVSPCRAN